MEDDEYSDIELFGEEDDSVVDGDELLCDLSAYVLFHEGSAGSPCLSFDVIEDEFGMDRKCTTPVSCCFIGGTQTDQPNLNSIILLKMSNLKRTEDEPDDEDEDSDHEAEMTDARAITSKHNGCINRIRATKIEKTSIVATWSELGIVNIWNIDEMYRAISDSSCKKNSICNLTPIYTSNNHTTEGFAIDWSSIKTGTLASGDCLGNIYIHNYNDGGKWAISKNSYKSHTKSVEDIQWSPTEENVFASCSVDKTIKIWDTRSDPSDACKLTCEDAHTDDINVIHWNKEQPFIASGSDDNQVKIWDLRNLQGDSPLALLSYHTKPITTVEWHPSDSSVLATGGDDDQILQWDLSVEVEGDQEQEDEKIPQQLIFVHKGQKEVKELHWHPQIPGLMITTALSGFNVFKTISC